MGARSYEKHSAFDTCMGQLRQAPDRIKLRHGFENERAVRGNGAGALVDARKTVVVAYQERKREELTHPLLALTVPLGLVPLVQARLLARAVREEAAPYVPFVPK